MRLKISNIKTISKPNEDEYTKIVNRIKYIKPVDIPLQKLANKIEQGYSFLVANFKENSKSINTCDIENTQLIAFDIDSTENPISRDNFINLMYKKYNIKPIIYYDTFSADERHMKFRYMFLIDEPISIEEYQNIIAGFKVDLDIYIDKQAVNINRVWNATNKKVYFNDEGLKYRLTKELRNELIKKSNKLVKEKKEKYKERVSINFSDEEKIIDRFYIKPDYKIQICDYINSSIDIKDFIIDHFGGEFKDHGSYENGVCTIHGGDNKGALVIFKTTNTAHCFTQCDRTYNVISLAYEYYKTNDFSNVAIKLMLEYGLDINSDVLGEKMNIKNLDDLKNIKSKDIEEKEEIKLLNGADIFDNCKTEILNNYKKGGYKAISTGFKEFDYNLGGGLYNGLYVIGATSSLGKTTLVHQIADNIIEKQPVLFISLEMSKEELISKSMVREAYLNNKNWNVGSRKLLNGNFNNDELEIFKNLENKYSNMFILEGNFSVNIDYIKKILNDFIKTYKKAPVLIIDYLQIIPPSNIRMTEKQNVDYNISELKRISRDYKTPVIAISSINRMSYIEEISFESFKESGSIEFGADVIIGLQLRILSDDSFKSTTDKSEKQRLCNDERSADNRHLTLKILKNRYGVSTSKIDFDYIPKCNYFYEYEFSKVEEPYQETEKKENKQGDFLSKLG